MKNKIIIPTIALIAIISIGGFVIIAGAFLSPNIALATKSNNDDTSDSNNDDTSDSSSSSSSSTDTFSQGVADGKAQGKTDAINGVNNSFCGFEHSNDYCAGYKVGYNANHVITNLVH